MLTLDLLTQIINSSHRWEVLEKLYNENILYFSKVNEIYDACMELYEISPLVIDDNPILLIPQITFHVFYWVGIQQLYELLKDTPYSHETHMNWYDELTYNDYLKRIREIISAFTGTFMKTLGLGELLVLFNHYLYKSEDFQEFFSVELAAFIYKEFQLGNLSPEFVSYLLSLLA
jgi:hypothetical protein